MPIDSRNPLAPGPSAQQPIDFRASVPVPFRGRYFVRLTIGTERRNMLRLDAEGQTETARTSIVYVAALSMLGGFSAFGFFCSVYLLKSMLGIDLFPGSSPMHPLFALLAR